MRKRDRKELSFVRDPESVRKREKVDKKLMRVKSHELFFLHGWK
jgi:hypothetical protein